VNGEGKKGAQVEKRGIENACAEFLHRGAQSPTRGIFLWSLNRGQGGGWEGEKKQQSGKKKSKESTLMYV